MPARGKHRRPKPQRFTRSLAVATTGGAALALPLMGAAGAHADTPQHAAPRNDVAENAKKAAATMYTVKPHDSLVKIAHKERVRGGWKRIYRDNRDVIGTDPALIFPGQKFVLGGKHAAQPHSPSGAKSGAKPGEESGAQPGAKDSADQSSGSGYTLPVDGGTLGTAYGTAGSMWSSGHHTGQDFIVPTGTPVHAVAEGTVVTAGWGGAYGNQVVIQHSDGKYSQYGHMSSLTVSAGQKVTEGQQIGLSGATGNVTGPHVHFEIRTTSEYGSDIDPIAYLRAHGLNL